LAQDARRFLSLRVIQAIKINNVHSSEVALNRCRPKFSDCFGTSACDEPTSGSGSAAMAAHGPKRTFQPIIGERWRIR
jgi:hypothetical protein